MPTVNLEKRIPFHLLPHKLVVHDPWNLLHINSGETDSDETDSEEQDKDDMAWTSKDDVVRTYRLQLSEMGNETVEKEKKLRAELVAKCQDISQREGIIYVPSDKTSENATSPAIMAFPPLCPPPPESVPEAHLYLSPAHRLGTGHHSVVYNAEWELPRSMLVKDVLCHQCIGDKMGEDLEERKRRGEYPYNGVEKEEKAEDVSESARTVRTRTYEGLAVKVFPEVEWQNPERGPYCSHIQKSMRHGKVPLTAKVSVAAKLSIQYDRHLSREAKNYQSFPAHLFEHWNGYNVIQPLHDPVPVGAVVPQFYGYYVPEKNEEDEYLSPILLLENCGVPINAEALNEDDKHECASLLFRMHGAGWNHGKCEFNL